MSKMLTEKELAEKTGLTVGIIANMRLGLMEGEHFLVVKKGVLYTEQGEEKIMEILGCVVGVSKKNGLVLQGPPAPAGAQDEPRHGQVPENDRAPTAAQPVPQKNGAEPKPEERKTDLVVIKVFPNPIWVQCLKKNAAKGSREFWNCRVSYNRRMRAGQALDGCLDEGDHFLYPRRILV